MRTRFTLLDPIRLLASMSVVSHHVRGTTVFGVAFGMTSFLVIMFALASSSTSRETLFSFARRKAVHLLSPWVRWSVVFLALFALRDVYWGHDPLDRLTIHTLFTGGHSYYWFLPLAAVAIVVARALPRVLARIDARVIVLGLGLAGAVSTVLLHGALRAHDTPHPYPGWIESVPALCYGVAVGQSMRLATDSSRRWYLLALVLLAGAAWTFAPAAEAGLLRRYAVSVPLACLGFAWRPRLPRFVSFAATTTFGIYMLHPLAIMGLRQVADPMAWPAVVHLGVVWLLSTALVLGLRRIRPRWQEAGQPLPARIAVLPHHGSDRTRAA